MGIGGAAEPTSSSTNLPASSAQTQTTVPNTQAQTAPVNASESEIKQAQEQLKSAGLYKGTADGKMGPETKQAISEFQQKNGLTKTGELDQQTMAALSKTQSGAASSLSGSSSTQPSASPSTVSPSTTPTKSR
jgi:peptidoglycan hydrolase-like protein with peptidoglycan-binding domain